MTDVGVIQTLLGADMEKLLVLVVLLMLMLPLGFGWVAIKFLAPLRAQAIPVKGTSNGGKDTLHVKLDRVGLKLDEVAGEVRETRRDVVQLNARVGLLEQLGPDDIELFRKRFAEASEVLGQDDEKKRER